MYDKKQVTNFRNRIRRATSSFSIGGDLLLSFEIDNMSPEQRLFLQQALLNSKSPVRYAYLDSKVTGA